MWEMSMHLANAGTGSSLEAPTIWARAISKRFGRRAVLRGVDVAVRPGRTLAVVGPNGAGKTTLLRVLATLARPSSGTVHLCGLDARANPVAARRVVGVVLTATLLYDDLTGWENLLHYARLYGVSNANRRVTELAELVGLQGQLHERVGSYSRGMAQRLSIARALLHLPQVLLLDEPDSGLDPATTRQLPGLLRRDDVPTRAIVLTCHDLLLALDLADDVAVLVDGRFAFAAPTYALTPDVFADAYRAVCGQSTPN